MRIKEAARRTGLTEKTIRYYEERGLVTPDKEERNGRVWRSYTEEHVAQLAAVATLRKAFFRVEEIDAIREDPKRIPETLAEVSARVEEAYETLGQLRALMQTRALAEAPDMLSLAEELSEAVKPLQLPARDVKLRFQAQDRLLAREQQQVDDAPALSRFGWVAVYHGQDEERFIEIRDRLTLFGVRHRDSSFTKGNRLLAQDLMNAARAPADKKLPNASPEWLQAKLLSSKTMDSYTIEVRKRDEEKARRAIQSAG